MIHLKAYHVRHKKDFSDYLRKAEFVAKYAVQNKHNFKVLTSKYVKKYGLPSSISNQILRKYGRGTIKEVSNVNLVIPNQKSTVKYKLKNGTTKKKQYYSIVYNNGFVTIKPLKLTFRWNPGKSFIKIHQIEINSDKFMLTVSFKNQKVEQEYNNVLGIDLNCGIGRSIANCANLKTNEILNLGVQGPNIRKYYFKKRKKHKVKNNKEKRRIRDLDHKISRKIVNYALKHKLKIVVENLKGIRNCATKKKGLRNVNRFVNSWSFYRLQTFIEYKSKELGIPFEKINPHYTSQECSYCSIIGYRKGDTFICNNKHCRSYKKKRHSDINAAFNIGKRSLQVGGRA